MSSPPLEMVVSSRGLQSTLATLQTERGSVDDQSLPQLRDTLSSMIIQGILPRHNYILEKVRPDGKFMYVDADKAVLYEHLQPAVEVFDKIKARLFPLAKPKLIDTLVEIHETELSIGAEQAMHAVIAEFAFYLMNTAGVNFDNQNDGKPFYGIALPNGKAIRTDSQRIDKFTEVADFADVLRDAKPQTMNEFIRGAIITMSQREIWYLNLRRISGGYASRGRVVLR